MWDAFAAERRLRLYLLTDALLLADVMHVFRAMCLKKCKLDP